MKYRQTHIPKVNISDRLKNCTASELREFVKTHYANHLQGHAVVNDDLKFEIRFTAQGKNKLSKGGSIYSKKAALVTILKEIVKHAEYSNFKPRKATDPLELSGYFNFKAKVKIDGVIQSIRFSALIYRDGKIYYNHEVSIQKK